jgi:SAM-dependent methyltransferase
MNEAHLRICSSPEWAAFVETELLPWALSDHDLGNDVLEVGPGPGLTTDVLRRRVPRLTAVEIDDVLAANLAGRLQGTNVEVVHGDGTSLPFDAGRFSSATLFTMLHHVPSVGLQDRLFAEVRRVLRPGGLMVGTDSVDTAPRRELHEGDTFVPVDPATLTDRLAATGFVDIAVSEAEDGFRFMAHAPA